MINIREIDIEKIEKVNAWWNYIKTYILGKDNNIYSEIFENSNASNFSWFYWNFKIENHWQKWKIEDFYIIDHWEGKHQISIIIEWKEYKQYWWRKLNGFSWYVW